MAKAPAQIGYSSYCGVLVSANDISDELANAKQQFELYPRTAWYLLSRVDIVSVG
jgi:hypothetical protein